jgi:hypothetical protein
MEGLVANIVRHIVQFVVTVSVFGSMALVVALIIPSTRAALARCLHWSGKQTLDQGDVSAQLAATNAQLAALRDEVYALRCEVASSAAVPGGSKATSLPSSGTRGNVS